MNGHEVIRLALRLRETPFQEFLEGLQVLHSPILSGSNFTQITTEIDKSGIPLRVASGFRRNETNKRLIFVDLKIERHTI
jgi:hypothetical protein